MCQLCDDSGFIAAYRKSDGMLFSFRSGCGVDERRNLSRRIPLWGSDKEVRFSLKKLNPEEQKTWAENNVLATTTKKDYKIIKCDPKAYDDDED